MSVKLLTEYHLKFLSLKGGYKGSSESILVKMSNCWKSHAAAHYSFSGPMLNYFLFRQFFKATVFSKLLQTDPYGRISIMQFFNYVMRKVWLHQTRIGLSLYDVAGQGYLKESVSLHAFTRVLQKFHDSLTRYLN